MLTSSLLLVLDLSLLRQCRFKSCREHLRRFVGRRQESAWSSDSSLEFQVIFGAGHHEGEYVWGHPAGMKKPTDATDVDILNFGIQNYWSRHQSFSRSCPTLWISIAWKWKGLGGPIRCCRDGANWMIPWSIVLWGLLQFGLFARSSGMKPVEMTSCHWELQLWKIMWIKLSMNFMWNPHTWIYMDLLW